MLIVTNAVTLEAYKSPGNCIGWEGQSFPSSYRHNQSLCGLVDWALTEVQPRAWEPCSREGSSLRAQAELNLWQSDTSHLRRLVCFQWCCSSLCVCVCVCPWTEWVQKYLYYYQSEDIFCKVLRVPTTSENYLTVWDCRGKSMSPQRWKYKYGENACVCVCVLSPQRHLVL